MSAKIGLKWLLPLSLCRTDGYKSFSKDYDNNTGKGEKEAFLPPGKRNVMFYELWNLYYIHYCESVIEYHSNALYRSTFCGLVAFITAQFEWIAQEHLHVNTRLSNGNNLLFSGARAGRVKWFVSDITTKWVGCEGRGGGWNFCLMSCLEVILKGNSKISLQHGNSWKYSWSMFIYRGPSLNMNQQLYRKKKKEKQKNKSLN